MKPEILAHAPLLVACLPALEEAFTVHRTFDAADPEAQPRHGLARIEELRVGARNLFRVMCTA